MFFTAVEKYRKKDRVLHLKAKSNLVQFVLRFTLHLQATVYGAGLKFCKEKPSLICLLSSFELVLFLTLEYNCSQYALRVVLTTRSEKG